jgi:hypothetical protein
MPLVNHPKVGPIEFPDEMSEADIVSALKKIDADIAAQQTTQQATTQDVQPSEPPPVPEMVPMAPGVGQTLKESAMLALSGGAFMEPFRKREKALEKERSVTASNLQAQLGLAEPVGLQERGPGVADRFMQSLSPNAEATRAYYEKRPGGGFIPLSKDNGLVRVVGADGKPEWVLNNPYGFSKGDIAAMVAQIPQLAAGAAAAFYAKGVSPAVAGAAASNLVGAATDVAFLALNDQPIDSTEILKRRGINTAVESAAGVVGERALPVAGNYFRTRGIPFLKDSPLQAVKKEAQKEALAAERFLKKQGVNVPVAGQVGQAVRELGTTKGTSEEAGNTIARAFTAADRNLTDYQMREAGRMAEELANRSHGALDKATTAATAPVEDAAGAAIGSAREMIQVARAEAGAMFERAFAQIDKDIISTPGLTQNFVKLEKSGALIQEVKDNLLKMAGPDGVVDSPLYAPMLSTLRTLEGSVGIGQRLAAVRNLRSEIGERIHGAKGGEVFPGLLEKQARRLYGALSDDIDNSIAKVGGQGGAMLKAANANYKQLVGKVEESQFFNDLLSGSYENPYALLSALGNKNVVGPAEWRLLQSSIDPQSFAGIRKALANTLQDSSMVRIGGREFNDISVMSDNLRKLPAEIKDSIFGGSSAWQSIEEAGKQFAFLKQKKGIFGSPALPTKEELIEAAQIAQTEGWTKGNNPMTKAMAFANKRLSNLASGIVSQMRTGNTRIAVENPDAFFESVVLSGNYSPDYLKHLMGKLSPQERDIIGNAAWQRIFDRAKPEASFFANGELQKASTQYEYDKIAKTLLGEGPKLGSKAQQDAIRVVIGDRRFKNAEALVKYQYALALETAAQNRNAQDVRKLISKAYFPNLFAAQTAAMVMDKASTGLLLREANPAMLRAFSTFQESFGNPRATRVTLQSLGLTSSKLTQAKLDSLWSSYADMLEGLTEEQQLAINNYLTGRE